MERKERRVRKNDRKTCTANMLLRGMGTKKNYETGSELCIFLLSLLLRLLYH